VTKLFSLFLGDRLPIDDEARTSRAGGNPVVEYVEGTHGPAQSIRLIKPDSTASDARRMKVVPVAGSKHASNDPIKTRSCLPRRVLTASMNI
jgi:hypothetical protein